MFGALPSAAGEAQRDATSLYREGLRMFRAGNFEGSIVRFQWALQEDPAHPYALLGLARTYHLQYEQSMVSYNEAAGFYERLSEVLGTGIREDVRTSLYTVYFHQGSLLMKGCDYEEAAAAFERYLALFPHEEDAHEAMNAVGVANYYMGRFEEAVSWFRKALGVVPNYAEARFNLRSVFTRLSLYAEAVALHRGGDLDGALAKLKALQDFAPHYAAGLQLYAGILADKGERDRALEIYRGILDDEEDLSVLYGVRIEVAKIHLGRGEKESAKTLLLENLQQLPTLEEERLRLEVLQLLAEALREPQ